MRYVEECEPHEHNTCFVSVSGLTRMHYILRTYHVRDCQYDVVLEHNILRMEPIVRDVHEVVLNFSHTVDISSIPDDANDRLHARYFRLRGIFSSHYHRFWNESDHFV